jgi:hypothetical protein
MINLLLNGNHMTHSPAELHGMLTGQLCSGAGEPDPDDLGQLLEQPHTLTPVLKKFLERLVSETAEHLAQSDFHYQPLLPDDDYALQERVSALGLWCDGFMVGFAAGYIRPESALSQEAREILGDFAQLATVTEDAEEVSEQDEVDYMELVEYVRVAAITLYQQLGEAPEPAGKRKTPVADPGHDQDVIH